MDGRAVGLNVFVGCVVGAKRVGLRLREGAAEVAFEGNTDGAPVVGRMEGFAEVLLVVGRIEGFEGKAVEGIAERDGFAVVIGAFVGEEVDFFEGSLVGGLDGKNTGDLDGRLDGATVAVGHAVVNSENFDREYDPEGANVGRAFGRKVGVMVDRKVGGTVGRKVGFFECG